MRKVSWIIRCMCSSAYALSLLTLCSWVCIWSVYVWRGLCVHAHMNVVTPVDICTCIQVEAQGCLESSSITAMLFSEIGSLSQSQNPSIWLVFLSCLLWENHLWGWNYSWSWHPPIVFHLGSGYLNLQGNECFNHWAISLALLFALDCVYDMTSHLFLLP